LQKELEKSEKGETTPDCRIRCSGCGVNRLEAGDYCENKIEI